jgi:vacuolar protein-sorting-associated protein 4
MNEQTKQKIRAKVESYLKRAEELKNMAKQGPIKKKALADDGTGRGNSRDNKNEDESGDPDRKRMMQKFEGKFHYIYLFSTNIFRSLTMLGAIVTDPNVSFADVIGLEQAKEALKEAVILPVKFPQLFQGISFLSILLILISFFPLQVNENHGLVYYFMV